MAEAVQTQQTQEPAAPPVVDRELTFTPEQRQAFKRGDVPAIETKPAAQPVTTTEPEPGETQTQQATQEVEAPAAEVNLEEVKVDEKGVARDKGGRFVKQVPYARFAEVASKAKQLEAQNLRLLEENARSDERLKLAATPAGQQQATQQQTKTDEPPKPQEDVFGAIDWLMKRVQEGGATQEQIKRELEEKLREQDAQRAYEADVQRARAGERPDYGDAYKHLLQARAKQLVLANPTAFLNTDGSLKEKEIREQLRAEEKDLRDNALRARRSPAEVIYQNALLFGYKAPEKTTQTTEQGKPNALAEIEAINRGAAASQSMRGAGGGAPLGEQLTRAKLASMSPTEFSAARVQYIAKNGKAAWLSLVG